MDGTMDRNSSIVQMEKECFFHLPTFNLISVLNNVAKMFCRLPPLPITLHMRKMNLIVRQLKRQIKKNLILAALIVPRFQDFKNRFKILDHC